ncbi:MAG TPA: aldose 1-epimerase family protein [Holophaga sp.]|nr:aldose 1-epimerase family protein [Holophaga sp.]
MDSFVIQNLFLRADIKAQGAELCSLRTLGGLDLLWDGNPSVWPRHSPHLFPVIGRLKDDTLHHQGRAYPMSAHGFARGMAFRMVRLTREDCTLVLKDDERTRAMYPFPFELRINLAVEGPALRVVYELINPGKEPLPADLGAHPAFRWPLVPGVPKEDHRIKFEVPEAAPIRRQVAGLLDPDPRPTPVEDRTLRLRDELFQDDVLIFDQLRSRRARYDAPGTPVLEFRWEGFEQLGIWTKPGAGFICIEPWRGLPSPPDFDGEFAGKPGILVIPPGGRRCFRYTVTVITEP